MIIENAEVRITDLSKCLDVSEAIIRRDLDRLASNRQLFGSHGGADVAEISQTKAPVSLRARHLCRHRPWDRAAARPA